MSELWYQKDAAQAAQELNTSLEHGLSREDAARRLEQVGPNELIDRGGKSPWRILLDQLTEVMVVILIIAAVISLFLGDMEDAIAILAIVILNTILGFTQEYRAEQAMAALKQMAVPHVRVRRGGQVLDILSRELVPGDLLLLEAGNKVPADGLLVHNANLRIQEAVLTGESEPVEKNAVPLTGENLALGDQRNRVFSGTVVTYGRGSALVTETGMQTELGRIASMIQEVGSEATPLQRRLAQLGKGLAVAALVIVGIVFVLGLLRGENLREMILVAISMAVAAVPEGLPTVVTIGLALGAQRMLKRQALIRKLPAVETLGSVTTICSDKTGTLTQNVMTVTLLDVADNQVDLKEELRSFSPTIQRGQATPDLARDPSIALLLVAGALSNDASLEPAADNPERYSSVGDPTEGALVIAAAQAGLWKDELERSFPRQAEAPFDSERKRMTTVHSVPQGQVQAGGLDVDHLLRTTAPALMAPPPLVGAHGVRPASQQIPASPAADSPLSAETPPAPRWLAFTKGAVDGMLAISTYVYHRDRVEPMTPEWRRRIDSANDALARSGMRVLGVAFRPLDQLPGQSNVQQIENELIFVGLAGMIDPARPEAGEAVRTARSAGIRPMMITGDHPLTALAIAGELGISQGDKVVTGQQLATMSDSEFQQAVREVSVYARVAPEHKLRIVDALQSQGEVVAMTGDGVNDAPALKKANIGVAMGITGTDVSKESSDMVLLDDNFATIVAAVEEGRRIYDNIRKFIRYALGSNIGEILVMLAAPFLGMPLPLLPIQILWVNLVTDGLPGLALTVEPAEKDTMRRRPHPPQESIFSRGLGVYILWMGILLGVVTLAIGYWAFSQGISAWQTMAFTTLTLAQMGHVIAVRSERESLFTQGIFSNMYLVGAVLLTILLQLAVVYVPFLQRFFETEALTLTELAICFLGSLVIFAAVEVQKAFVRRA